MSRRPPIPAAKVTVSLAASWLIVGCSLFTPEPAQREAPAEVVAKEATATPPEAAAAKEAPATFGAPLSPGETVSLAAILKSPQSYKDKTVLVEAHVRKACSRKGCWMEVSTENSETAPGCRVTFEDYAFFVPTNAAGSKARLQGKVRVTQVAASHVEHLESEGGTFKQKNADGSATEVQLLASGVELTQG